MIKLNKTVREIHWKEEGDYPIRVVSIHEVSGQKFIFKAKFAIMTFRFGYKIIYLTVAILFSHSIGVLQHSDLIFEPPLPRPRKEIINMFRMTSYIKIFLKFPTNTTRFWDDTHYIMYVDPLVPGKFTGWQNLEAGDRYFPR